MAEQIDILDFNEAHRNRNSQNQDTDRFSVRKIKQLLTLEDVDSWVEQINMPQTRNFEYPSSIEKAIIHSQSFYIHPDKKFLKENPKVINCDCCGQMIRRKRYNIFTCDMYSIFAGEFGISIPLYFSIIKLHFFILLAIGCIFGIYYCYLSDKYCGQLNLKNFTENQLHEQYCTSFLAAQHFLLYNFNQEEIVNKNYGEQNTFYILGYVAYLIMMMTPLMHEVLLRLQQIKYWNYDSLNHIRIPKLTLYIKHIPKKFNEQELQLYIQNAIASKYKDKIGGKFIEEIVYIYDIHPIKVLNEKRKETYLKSLQIVNELKVNPKLELKGQLIDLVFQLIKQTRDIQKTLQYGLPFTQKVILKFNSESVTNLVYKFYDKSFFNNLLQRIETIKESAQNYQEFQKDKFELQAQLLEQSQTNSSKSSMISQQSDLQEMVRSQSEIFNQPSELKAKLKQSIIDLLHLPENDEQQEMTMQQSTIDEKKGLHLQRGFRQDDIFWEHIGMHTLKRFFLRLITTCITLFVGIIIMALFEILFIMEQHLKRQDGWVSSLIVIVMTLFTVFLSVFSTILVIFMTKRSQRSTYSLQEKNIITFMSPIQQVCILAFPFIFVLSILQKHSALNSIAVVLAVSKLAQVRLISKGIIHFFHLRSVKFNSLKKKIQKNFKPTLYFQKQLNDLITPPLFPIRSRLFYILFIYSTGMMMIFFNPIMILWCLILQVIFFYYDKYSVLNEYHYDKLFTFQLQKYLILTYQVIMIPIYCYIYVVTFTNTTQHIGSDGSLINQYSTVSTLWTFLGYGTCILSFTSFLFFRQQIANFFVFVVLRYQKPLRDSTIFNEKSYFQSYNEYFHDLGVHELNTILEDTFKNMQYKSK
ncbi:unnamed protein product [Paramecium octaurelia]|uniref:Uncharacterized protein n=1 Tax=Paramecium octaurelia TaxID=43137 RepID=A0A8S1U1F5_PAROT|nr:unnamed protein product [Paramecium octaurelia]